MAHADEVLVDLHVSMWRGSMAERLGVPPESLSAHEMLADMHVAMWGEQRAQRERAERAEERCEELERLLGESRVREAAWAERARGVKP